MSAAPVTSAQRFAPVWPGGAAAQPSQAPQRPLPSRSQLRVVKAPERSASIVPFAWLCLSIIVAAMATVLILNIAMTSRAYEAKAIRIEIAQLHQQRAGLLVSLESNAAPSSLAGEASALGMVPATSIGFVSITDATVIQAGG